MSDRRRTRDNIMLHQWLAEPEIEHVVQQLVPAVPFDQWAVTESIVSARQTNTFANASHELFEAAELWMSKYERSEAEWCESSLLPLLLVVFGIGYGKSGMAHLVPDAIKYMEIAFRPAKPSTKSLVLFILDDAVREAASDPIRSQDDPRFDVVVVNAFIDRQRREMSI